MINNFKTVIYLRTILEFKKNTIFTANNLILQ